jgi:transposase
MSERELQRVSVLAEVLSRNRTASSAAHVLGVSERQVWRLLGRYKAGGAPSLSHKARGKPAHNQMSEEIKTRVLALFREHYRDFGPTLASEFLVAKHGLSVSRETLRHWVIEAGLWLPRRQRRQFHLPRLRRERLGELIQIDGSEHRWFENRADPCTLLVFIDDATGKLMQLRFAPSESAFAYFDALEGYLTSHGRPLAFYSDKHSVFRVAKTDAKGGHGMTQFGRALSELSIEILCANSSQAKGRVERVNRTLQDRLVKELRLEGITGIAAGNEYLPGFVERFNARFTVPPARAGDLHRPLNVAPARLKEILCWHEKRYVSEQLGISYERKRIILAVNDMTRGLVGQYVDVYVFSDETIEIRWKGLSLPHTIFDKHQRVTHTAIVENKRLSAVLAQVKEWQDTAYDPPRIKTTSEAGGYQPSGTKHRGRKSFVEKHYEAKGAK